MPGVDEGTTHNVCGVDSCPHCHCHACVMQEREVKRQAIDALAGERDRLREALNRYGTHHRECPLADSIARLRGVVPCTCGLQEAMEKTNG
jgi:hypothetical protein